MIKQTTKNLSGYISGITAMFGAATIWGTWVLVISAVSLPSIYILPITFSSSAIALTLIALVTHKKQALIQIFKNRSFMRLLLSVAIFEVIQSSLYIVSYSIAIHDGGSVVIPIIRSLVGIITPILATVSRNEQFSRVYLFYGTVSSLGAILIFSRGGISAGENISYLGLGMVVLSVIVRAWFYLKQRQVAQQMTMASYQASHVLTVQLLVSSVILMGISFVYFVATPRPDVINPMQELMVLALLGLVHTGMASLLRLLAMKKITAQQSVIIMYFEPFLSVMLSIIFLGERVTIGFFIGAFMILMSAGASSIYSSKKKAG